MHCRLRALFIYDVVCKTNTNMATGNGGHEEGSWWGGWIQAAKEKSAVALEQMKRDLGEFGSTIQRDTSSAVVSSAGVIRESLQTEPNESSTSSRVKKGFSNLLSELSESLAPRKQSSEEETQAVSSKTSHHIFDRAKARLHSMQVDAGTYCTDPDGPADVYQDWLLSFDTDNYKGDISDLLVSNTDVRAIYTKLVPAVVSNADFWGRYFYKVRQLEQDEARRTALKERADMTSSQTFDIEELQWDEEEEDSSVTMESPECRSSSTKHKDLEDRVASPAGSRVLHEQQECPKPSVDKDDERIRITTTETPTEQPCQHQRLTTEPETELVDQDDKTTTVRAASTSELERASENQCSEHTQRVVHTQGEHDTVQQGGEEVQNLMPSDTDEESKDHTQTEGSSTQAADNKGMAAGALMVHVPTEETHLEKQIDKKISPSGSDASNKDSSLSDDWERDFDDLDVTDEDLAAAAAMQTKIQPKEGEEEEDLDDWENWE